MAATATLRTLAMAGALGCIIEGIARSDALDPPTFLSRDLFDFFAVKSSSSQSPPERQKEDPSEAEDDYPSWTPASFPSASVSAPWHTAERSITSNVDQANPLEAIFEEIFVREFPDDVERRAARAIIKETVSDDDSTHNPEDFTSLFAAALNLKEQLLTSINTLMNDDIGKSLGVSLPQVQQQKVESILKFNVAKKLRLVELMKAFLSLLRLAKGGTSRPPSPPAPPPPPPPPPPRPTTTTSTTTTPPKKPPKPPHTNTSTGKPGGGNKNPSAPGNSETILLLQVAPLTLLNRICQGQREACAQVFGDSLHEAMVAETGDSSFTRDRIKIGVASPRGGGVQQPVIIYHDGELYWAGVLKKVVQDLSRCSSDGSLPICTTMTGQNLTQNHVPVTVSSQKVVG